MPKEVTEIAMSVPNFLKAKNFAIGTNYFSSENPTENNRSSKSFTSKSSWLHANERRQGNSAQMQSVGKSFIKRNNPESWKAAVLMPEACICESTAVIWRIHVETYLLRHSKHKDLCCTIKLRYSYMQLLCWWEAKRFFFRSQFPLNYYHFQ